MKQAESGAMYVVCVEVGDFQASLETRKIYQAIPDEKASAHNLLRVIDESGEDYLYPAEYFMPLELPAEVRKALSLSG